MVLVAAWGREARAREVFNSRKFCRVGCGIRCTVERVVFRGDTSRLRILASTATHTMCTLCKQKREIQTTRDVGCNLWCCCTPAFLPFSRSRRGRSGTIVLSNFNFQRGFRWIRCINERRHAHMQTNETRSLMITLPCRVVWSHLICRSTGRRNFLSTKVCKSTGTLLWRTFNKLVKKTGIVSWQFLPWQSSRSVCSILLLGRPAHFLLLFSLSALCVATAFWEVLLRFYRAPATLL